MREALERAAKQIGDRFKDQPLQEAAVRMTIGTSLRGLGEAERAEPHLQRSLALYRRVSGSNDLGTLYAMSALARVYDDERKFDQALPLYQETLKLMKAKFGPDDEKTLNVMNNLAIAYHHAGKLDQALPLFEEALKLKKVRLGPTNRETLIAMNNLAATYHRLDQALPLYQQTLELMRARLGPYDPYTQLAIGNLADAYSDSGKLDQALPLWEEALKLRKTVLGLNNPDTLAAMKARGALYARLGQWDKAAADFVRVREINPEDHEAWHRLAAFLVASGQVDVYREHCRKSAERFGQTSDPNTAERIAKDCLILPASGVDLDVVAKMADTAAAATNHMDTRWFQLVKGLAEYRQGRFPGAAEWVNKTLTGTGKEPERDVQAYMVLAMAHYQLKQTDEARAAFASGGEIERTKLPKLESGDIGGMWLDWIIAHALMREAKALIEGSSETKAETR